MESTPTTEAPVSPASYETSTQNSPTSRQTRARQLRLRRSRTKARFNELAFAGPDGEKIENNWHHVEWFDLTEFHDRLLIEAAREHAKTEIFGKTLPLFEIGINPNIRILIVSATFDQAAQRSRVLREHIERNEHYGAIFPHVSVASKKGDEQFTVERDRILKEPTVLSTYAGGPTPGYRFDIVILDDLVSFLANSTTTAKRDKLHRWVADEVLNAVARAGKVWVIGTRQHHDDEYERLKADERFTSVTYPALDEAELGYPEKNAARGITGPDADCLWPAMHNRETLEAKRKANPDSFARQQQQIAIPETGLVFRRELTDAALERGKTVEPVKSAAQFLALDPGYGKRAALLAVQERAGDRIEMWKEHSFTQMDDDAISAVAVEHCREWGVQMIYADAEDPGLLAAIARDLKNAGLPARVQPVPFAKYKRLAIKATRWMLAQEGRVSWRAQTTTVHVPGQTTEENSIFRKEIRDYALKEGEDDVPIKDNDHGPDAFTAYMSRWIGPWLAATGQAEKDAA